MESWATYRSHEESIDSTKKASRKGPKLVFLSLFALFWSHCGLVWVFTSGLLSTPTREHCIGVRQVRWAKLRKSPLALDSIQGDWLREKSLHEYASHRVRMKRSKISQSTFRKHCDPWQRLNFFVFLLLRLLNGRFWRENANRLRRSIGVYSL